MVEDRHRAWEKRLMGVPEKVLDVDARTANLLRGLQSPLIPVLDVGEDGGWMYLPGGALPLIEKMDRMGPREVMNLLRRLAEGLERLHDQGWLVVSLDPEAVYLAGRRPLLTEFDHLTRIGESAERIPQLRYVAPECGRGKLDRTADVYALGTLAYRLLCGRPHEPGTGLEGVPLVHRRLLARLLAPNPEHRLQGMTDVCRAIEDGLREAEPVVFIEAAAFTHAGFNPLRGLNQDASFMAWQQYADWEGGRLRGLFAVIDGMGGMQDGHLAARVVWESFRRSFGEFASLPNPPSAEDLITRAHHEVARLPDDGGAACTLLALDGDRLDLAHAGDTRAYLVREGEVFFLTGSAPIVL